jgi:acetolactate synthase-1/2/3 large subunit
MPKGSDLLVRALENEGVERIFGVPGEENLDVVESLRNSSIKLIITRHEQGAAFMAATYGRLTGKPGVCIATLGPGALNFTTSSAYALLGAMPMIMITGQKGIMSSRQARFQIVDIVSAFRPLTKMSRQIVGTATIPTLVRDAFRVAMEERPGPVLLELPEDVAGEECEDRPVVPVHPIEIPVAHRAALDRAAQMILAAKRPLIMLGAGTSRPRVTGGLNAFVRRTQIPFFTTQMGKGTVAGGSNLYVGAAASSQTRPGLVPRPFLAGSKGTASRYAKACRTLRRCASAMTFLRFARADHLVSGLFGKGGEVARSLLQDNIAAVLGG